MTGGSAVRIKGADKASLEVGGATLLERALDALAEVTDVVVVGEPVRTTRTVRFRREEPAGGGPAAGLLAGLSGFPGTPAQVVVLAVDMPLVTTATVRRLLDAAEGDGALLVDDDGRQQYLCGVYSTKALLAAAPPVKQRNGLSMKRLVAGLSLALVQAHPGETRDVDTWEDLLALRNQLKG